MHRRARAVLRAGFCLAVTSAGCGDRTGLDDYGSPRVAGDGGGPTTGPPSCESGGPGMSNRGPGGSGTESCCTSLEVPGGTYYRTYTSSETGPTLEAAPATVSSFRLDKYLVTVGRFRQFVSAWSRGWLPQEGAGKHIHLNGGKGLANSATPGTYELGWVTSDNGNVAPTDANLACSSPSAGYATWTPAAGSQENLPINCVNWWESYAFCIWDGGDGGDGSGFLPTEAEWEYAAAGGSRQRTYPWGSTPADPAHATYGCDYPTASGMCSGAGNIAPVGYAAQGAGVWGQLDLAGEVWEWNVDWYADYVNPCTDCAYLTAPSDEASTGAGTRVFRGGIFLNYSSSLLSANRYSSAPTDRDGGLGFRCARTL
jgi:sulfatase modifying factor 1